MGINPISVGPTPLPAKNSFNSSLPKYTRTPQVKIGGYNFYPDLHRNVFYPDLHGGGRQVCQHFFVDDSASLPTLNVGACGHPACILIIL